jgi:transposase InsO family protein
VDEERRQLWAQFRFEVIAPLLDDKLDGAEKARLRQEVLAKIYTTPDGKAWRIAGRTLRNWLNRYRRGQLEELANRPSKTRGQMKALDEIVLDEAKGLRERMRTRSIQDILMHLKFTSSIDISKISASTLNRHLNRVGATKSKNYSERGTFQHFQKEHINQTWQSDCSDGLYLPDPLGLKEVRQTTLITCIDDASRFCVHGQFYWTEQLLDLLDCFKTALTARGKPGCLYTDNGSIYRSNDLKSICTDLGIDLKHSEEYQPEGKGKQERYYLTMQMRFYKEAKKAGITTLQELNEFFWAWLDECYHKVRHNTLKMTPLERWQREESLIKRLGQEEIQRCMQLRARRTVDTKTALIRLDGRRYQASQNLAGKRLQVRWPFDDISAVNIWQSGAFVERAELFVPSADIDYSKRPVRQQEKAEEPKVLDCSKRLRLSLVAKYRGEKPPEDTSRYGVLTEREFIYVVEQCLQRSLTDVDTSLLSQCYKFLCPFDAAFVQQCMSKAITEKGARKHLSFYLGRLKEARIQKR